VVTSYGVFDHAPDFHRKFIDAAAGRNKENIHHDGRYRFIVDMSEYHNEEIQLRVKGRKLIVSQASTPILHIKMKPPTTNLILFLQIEGSRPQQEPWISQRKTTEMVELPPHVHADNLRVDRDTTGFLYFQEAWKF
jgi:hypothetical protein